MLEGKPSSDRDHATQFSKLPTVQCPAKASGAGPRKEARYDLPVFFV